MSSEPIAEFEARQFCFDLEMRGEAMHDGLAKTNCDPNSTWIGTIGRTTTTQKLESTGLHELKIDESDRVSVSTEPRVGVRVSIINLALGASCGLVWIAVSTLVSPLGLSWGTGPGGYHFLDPMQPSSGLRDQSSAARILDSKKGDRLQIVGRSAIDAEREASPKDAESQKGSQSVAGSPGKPFLGADPPASSVKNIRPPRSSMLRWHPGPKTCSLGSNSPRRRKRSRQRSRAGRFVKLIMA